MLRNDSFKSLSDLNSSPKCLNTVALNSDGFSNLKQKFDFIITNPPIRVGKEKLYSLFIEARKYLNELNSKAIVICRDVITLYYNMEEI